MLHQDAIVDDTYIKNGYYAPEHQMLNRGGLTLISNKYFPFGLALMEKIRKHISFYQIVKLGNNCYA